jgi:hypothetical protein
MEILPEWFGFSFFFSLSLDYYGFIPFNSYQLGNMFKKILFPLLILYYFLKTFVILLLSTIERILLQETTVLEEFKDSHSLYFVFQLISFFKGD